jgi:drug/metabolite transporter (DMT)-like permease
MNYTIYVGTSLTTSGRTVIFFYMQPLFLAVLAHYFLPDDRLTLRKTSGLVLALLSLIVLFMTKLSTGHPPTRLGDSLVLTGALSFALQNLIIKRAVGKIHPVAIILWSSLGCSLVLGVCWSLFEYSSPFVFSLRASLSLLYLSHIYGAFAFVALASLLQNNSATRVNALIFLAPVFGVLLGLLLLGEPFTNLQFLGMTGICIGVYIVTSSRTPQTQSSGEA